MSETKTVTMAAKIRELIQANPTIKSREAIEKLAKEGHKIASSQFYYEKKKLAEAGAIQATVNKRKAKKLGNKVTTEVTVAPSTAIETPIAVATTTSAKASSTAVADAKEMLRARRAIRQAVVDAVARVGSFQAVDFLYEDIKRDLIG